MLLGWCKLATDNNVVYQNFFSPVPPIPFVVIGLASVLNQYGVYIDGELA